MKFYPNQTDTSTHPMKNQQPLVRFKLKPQTLVWLMRLFAVFNACFRTVRKSAAAYGAITLAIGMSHMMAQDSSPLSPPTPAPSLVGTDKSDYAPGETAVFTGNGFAPGETVILQVLHQDGTSDGGADHQPWRVVADPNGGFQTTWHVCEDDCLGSILRVSADGQTSGLTAAANFSDATVFIFVGAFYVGDGPCWDTVPPCYTAKEAAALLFGGAVSDYAISINSSTTDPLTITHTAYVDGYGNTTYLNTPASEDFKQNSNYYYPAFSAFVHDHSDGSFFNCYNTGSFRRNYVWRKTNTPPTVICSGSSTLNCAPSGGMPVFVSANVTDPDASQTLTVKLKEGVTILNSMTVSSPANNSLVTFNAVTLLPGTHTLTVEVSDGTATASCQTTVTIAVDTTPPVITGCPGNIVVLTGPGRTTCDQVATWTWPTASDNCTFGMLTLSRLPGGTFPVGTTTVTCMATDGAGNKSFCSFTVTVVDNTPPVIPSLATVTGQCSATVTAPTTTDNCAGTVTGTTSDPLVYNTQGTFTVHWTFNDGNGNSSTANQTVIVKDTTAPVAPLLADVTGQCSATVTAPTTTDNCAGAVTGTTSDRLVYNTQGTFIVHWTFSDGNGNSSTANQTVIVQDTTAPVAPVLANVTGQCSATVTAPTATDNCAGTVTGTTSDPLVYNTQGTFTMHWTFNDGHGNSSTASQTVIVQDTTAPVIVCPADKLVNADPLVCTAVVNGIGPTSAGDNCSGYTIAYTLAGATTGSGVNDASGSVLNIGLTTVTYTITDVAGLTAACSFTVTVLNPNPVVMMTGPASGSLYAINTPVNFTATFTDAGGGTHTGTWMLDSIPQAAVIVEPSGATPGSANATYTFTAPGVYTVKLAVNDSCGGSGTANQIGGMDLLVVVYDPSAGFVTGGGWINSPVGAYVADPSLTGKANFGFVSKYQKGQSIPTGETEFQLHFASFNFHSTSYQWLVVSGAKAQYKGFGQINGAGDYGFLVTATDGQITGGGGVDKFRIKIWDKTTSAIVYDNAMGDSDDINSANPQAIGGGSIVIHNTK